MKNELSRCEALWWQRFCWEPPFSYFLQHTRLLLGQHGQTCLSVISAEGQEPDLIQLFLPAEDQEEEMGVNDSGRYLWRSHFYSFSYLDVIQMTTAPARSSLKHEPLMASTPPVGLMPGEVWWGEEEPRAAPNVSPRAGGSDPAAESFRPAEERLVAVMASHARRPQGLQA